MTCNHYDDQVIAGQPRCGGNLAMIFAGDLIEEQCILPVDHAGDDYHPSIGFRAADDRDDLRAQRDALLNAAKEAEARLAEYELNYRADLPGEAYDDAYTARRTLAAAIKQAESRQPARQADGPPVITSACRGEEPS